MVAVGERRAQRRRIEEEGPRRSKVKEGSFVGRESSRRSGLVWRLVMRVVKVAELGIGGGGGDGDNWRTEESRRVADRR